MPTTKPRISLIIEPERYELYKQVAELQGVKIQTVLTDMLDMAHPAIEQAAGLLVKLHNLPKEHQAEIMLAADKAEGVLNEVVSQFVGQFTMTEELSTPADGGPRTSNTGSTFHSQVQNPSSPPSSPPLSSPPPEDRAKGAA